MSSVILLIIILGGALGLITFFVLKTIIAPKKMATLADMVKQGKTGTVIRSAKQIVAKEPRNFEAHYLLGLAYLAENRDELALMELKTVNQIGSFSALCPETQFREKIAALYQKFNQPEEALKEYLLLIKKDPTNGDLYFKSGTLFEDRNKTDKAINYYRKAIELEPRHKMAHYKLGMLLYRAKKPVEAKDELEKAIKINPDNLKAYFYIGRLLKENHDYIGALHAFEKSQRDPEQKLKSLIERGVCYMSMNNIEHAISELERAIKLPQSEGANEAIYAHYFLGLCYEKIRNIDKAIENWEKVYAKKSNFKDVAEKLSQYQDLRQDDRVKDYLTASMEEFHEICKGVAASLDLSIRDVNDIPNGCQIIAVESSSKWRAARKMPKLLRFLRTPDLIPESTIRSMHEEMKKISVTRGMVFSSSNFSRKAQEFAESRPIDLIDVEKLQQYLKQAEPAS